MLPRDYMSNPSIANPDVNIAGMQYERNPGAEYGEHIKDTFAICNTSASHTYGNVLSVIEKYLLDQFNPQVEFGTVMANTALASRQIRHLPNQLYKKELPLMALIPRISFGQDDNRFLGHTLINDRVTDTHALWGDGSLIPLAEDKKKPLWIHGHLNRALMFVDVVLAFNTYPEQINCESYIHNILGVNHPKDIRAPLELYIPMEFCNVISHLANVPIKNDSGSVYDFMTYMNSIWSYPITYKLKGGSNTDEFFMYHVADIVTVIQDVSHGTGVKDGQIKRAFDVTFTVRCEFNTIGYFSINSPKISMPSMIPTKNEYQVMPIFTDVIDLDDFVLPIGWTIHSWPVFKLADGENFISLEPILNKSLNAVIDYHLRFGIPMNKFITIQFRENGTILSDEAFYIDWTLRRLFVVHPNIRRTYRLIICISADYINNLVKELYNLE